MKILITGATGFVGAHLARVLVAYRHEVFALVRPTSRHDELHALGVTLLYGDLQDGPTGGFPTLDAVIHVAGLIKAKNSHEFYAVNTHGTQQFLRQLGDVARIVLVSSIAARGPNADAVDLLGTGPVSHYGKSKLGAEDVALMQLAKDKLVIVRPPVVYGPADRETLRLFKMLKRGIFPVLGKRPTKVSFVYIEDLCRALMVAATAPFAGSGPFYPDDGQQGYSWEEIAAVGQSLYGKPVKMPRLPFGLLRIFTVIVELMGKIFGFAPMLSRDKYVELRAPFWFCSAQTLKQAYPHGETKSLAEGFRETDQWYRENGWL